MIKHKDHFHGSDLEKIEQIYGIKKEEIVSFSANVNPLGVSPLLRTTLADKIDAITTYPDREYTSLRKCIAAYCGTDHENVIVGNGSTAVSYTPLDVYKRQAQYCYKNKDHPDESHICPQYDLRDQKNQCRSHRQSCCHIHELLHFYPVMGKDLLI